MKDVNEVIKENEKLITYVIKKFFPKELGDEDIYQIGRIALWESITKYNETRGAKFNTFAIACIKLKIARELQKRSYKIRAEDNNLIYENENFELANIVKDNLNASPEDEIIMKEIIEELDSIEKKIVALKSNKKTNEEIAKSLQTSLSTINRKTKNIKNKIKEVI